MSRDDKIIPVFEEPEQSNDEITDLFNLDIEKIEYDTIYELARKLEKRDRESLGGDIEINHFQPAEAVWLIDAYLSRRYNRAIGGLAGVIYTQTTLIVAGIVWLSFFYLTTLSTTTNINESTWAAFSVTMGSFVLISGSNLVDHYEENDLNFKSYVHNSITFIVSGILFAVGYIIESFFNPSFNFSTEIIPFLLLAANNLVGTLIFTLSIWVLLKILWRLNQLINWETEYTDKSPYSEIKSTLGGFYYGLTRGGEQSAVIGLISLVLFLSSFLIPFYYTSQLRWGIVGVIGYYAVGLLLSIITRGIKFLRR